MTVKEIQGSDKAFLTPADIAEVLGSDKHTISIVARDNPEKLGFPVTRIGNRTKIPRLRFLAYLGYTEGVIAEK